MANRKSNRKSPDARLIALGVELESAIKAWRKAYKPFAAAEAKWIKAKKNTATEARLRDKKEAANEINYRALAAVRKTACRILKTQASTLEGVMVKFYATAWNVWGEENPRAFELAAGQPAAPHGEDAVAFWGIGCDLASIIKRAA